ncbi:AprI/Inh family metalloprotease inhibitor [Stappia sp. F7233]|uniref:AprI/Inh family metalloprotease inhibitor n=1 Tax=Stappia albiluteola TaxID=2758565 RepID=A0A839AFC8_9HYPH|nr:AprI/Inh family metalloprotease inhibitor [Stappia albiluteola]MBA5778413.1 AprI/Inh family metalloprotease inhibitor [Stappia albiluteola]
MSHRLVAPLAAILLAACQADQSPPAYTPSPAAISAVQPANAEGDISGDGPLVLDSAANGADPFLPDAGDYPAPAGDGQSWVDLAQGSWKVAGGAASGCQLRFDHPAANGIAAASARHCPTSQLAEVSSWRGAGDRIELFSASGTPVAFLYVDRPDLLTGYMVDGPELVVSR